MAHRLTDQQVASIRSLAHLPQRDIAKRVGVSLSSVNGVLRTPAQAPAAVEAPSPPTEPADDESLPIEARLARVIASLERASKAAAAGGDHARSIAAERAATAALALAARLAPVDTVPAGMMLVPAGEMKALGEKTGQRFEAILDDMFAEADKWPKCGACGQPIPPKEAP